MNYPFLILNAIVWLLLGHPKTDMHPKPDKTTFVENLAFSVALTCLGIGIFCLLVVIAAGIKYLIS